MKRLAAGAGAVLLVAAALLHLLSSWRPRAYRPAQLKPSERVAWAKHFTEEKLAPFSNRAQGGEPYTWSITEDQLNKYLASLDEIVSLRPNRRPGEVHDMMREAGLTGPAVVLGRDAMTVMIQTTKHNKLLSVDLAFQFTENRRLLVRLTAARIGRLPVPRSLIRDQLKDLQTLAKGDQSGKVGTSPETERGVLAKILSAIDKEAIDPDFVWPFMHKPVRIENIEIKNRRLTLHVRPIRR